MTTHHPRPSVSSVGRGGFTLIEIMVAILLLLVVMVGFLPLFLQGLNQTSDVRYRSIANNIARERMEEVRRLDYREIQEDVDNPTDPRNLSVKFGSAAIVRDIPFTVSYDVDTVGYGTGQLKNVTITVSWTGNPTPSPAVITSLIHQQFLGARGARLEITPTKADPLGTPFPVIPISTETTTAKYYIAQADWNLVYDGISAGTPTPKTDVYMRLVMVDDFGGVVPLGNPDDDYKIDASNLRYSVSTTTGAIDNVWFEWLFNARTIPDGYYDTQAVAFNTYDQPGNVWHLRVRVETGPPDTPTITGVAVGNDLINLAWTAGTERDRNRYELVRRWVPPEGEPAIPDVTVNADPIEPNRTTFADQGSSVEPLVDPWGIIDTPRTYTYLLTVYDIAGNAASAWSNPITLPGSVPFITITNNSSLPPGQVDSSYSITFAASGDTIVSWAVSNGTLPPGLALDVLTGVLSGTPTAAGTYNFEITADGATGASGIKGFSLTVNPSSTPTTIPTYTVIIRNNSETNYTAEIRDESSNPIVTEVAIPKREDTTITITASGGNFNILAFPPSGKNPVPASFSLPGADGTIVMTLT